MKKHVLILAVFLNLGPFLYNAVGQANANLRASAVSPSNAAEQANANAQAATVIPRRPTVSNEAVDVRARYAAITNHKRDGRFLLYSDPDGTKVFLTVKGGQPGPYLAFDSGGQNLPIVLRQNGYGRCYICFGRGHTKCIRIKCPID